MFNVCVGGGDSGKIVCAIPHADVFFSDLTYTPLILLTHELSLRLL